MSGASIAADVAAAYQEVGVEVGSGVLTLTVKRAGTPTGTAYAPTPGTPTDHTFTAKPVSIEQAQRAGMTLATGERVYSLVNHGVTIAPTVADELVIGGETWSIVEVIATDSAGYVLTWMVKVSGPVG
jgi:hypothetical protein